MSQHAFTRLALRGIGWFATVLSTDPTAFDRWIWLRRRLTRGPARTLDAGCGAGAFTMYAAKLGNEAVGVSLDEDEVRKARFRAETLGLSNVRFVQGDLRRLDEFGPELGVFDQILCLETIEHVLDDRKLIADLASRLSPGGRLLLTTPSETRRPWWKESTSPHENGGHVRWGYTDEAMRELLEANGLRVVAAEHICGCVSRLLVNIGRRFSRFGYRAGWAIAFPLRVFQLLDRPLTRRLRHPFSCIAVVGVRDELPASPQVGGTART